MSAQDPADLESTSSSSRLSFISDPSIRYAAVIFVASRLFFTLWALVILAFRPQPQEPDELLRPYLDQPRFVEGLTGALLGPWQRFDTLHYMRIAEAAYQHEEDSVFPPLYPALISGASYLMSPILPPAEGSLLAGIMISNISFFGALVLLYRLTQKELSDQTAKRTIVLFAIFPTSFFLLAAYSESLFILLAVGSIYSARGGRFLLAGILALLASLTRLTGAVLILPLVFEYFSQRNFNLKQIDWSALALLLPVLGTAAFMAWRSWSGLPPLSHIYESYWFQKTGFPGVDLVWSLVKIVQGEAAFTLYFDFFCALLLIGTTVTAFKILGTTYGLYSLSLLLFILLPTSELKPLYSFSRYALAFFPMFMILGNRISTPWRRRTILYPSIALLLYFSGQFFMWGWVA